MSKTSSSSNINTKPPIVFVTVSLLSLGILIAPALRVLHARANKRRECIDRLSSSAGTAVPGKHQSHSINDNDNDNTNHNRNDNTAKSGIEIHYSPTARNKKIIRDAVILTQSEPWGYTNRHFASLLAQIRPWPYSSPFVIHSVKNHWGKGVGVLPAPTRRLEHICTPAGCHIEVEYIEPMIPVRQKSGNGTGTGATTTPTVILLHGIGGSSKEIYIEQAAIQIVEKGWNVVILNYSKVSVVNVEVPVEHEDTHTGTGNTDMPCSATTSSHTVSVGGNCLTETHDISFLVSHIRKKHSGFLCCIGFSMGGTKM